MEDSNPPTNPPRTSRPRISRHGRTGTIGGLVGVLALVASLFALSATASADAPELTTRSAESARVLDEDSAFDEDSALDEDEFEDDLPEELRAAEECWLALEAEYGLDELDDDTEEDGTEDDVLEEAEDSDDVADGIDWAAFDAEAEACEALLPENVRAELAAEEAAWEEFDACVDAVFDEYGIEDELDDEFGNGVSIMTDDDLTFAEFGEGDGSITVNQVGGVITVTTDGDVTVEEIDESAFDEIDEALVGCEESLPGDLLDESEDDYDEFEEDEFDDEFEEDELEDDEDDDAA